MLTLEKNLFCTFTLGDLFLAIPVLEIAEIIQQKSLVSVPLSPPEVAGIINLRGKIITLIDLRYLLTGKKTKPPQNFTHIVLQGDGLLSSFLVDELGDILELDPDRLALPPQSLRDQTNHLIQQIYQSEKELILILDTKRTLS